MQKFFRLVSADRHCALSWKKSGDEINELLRQYKPAIRAREVSELDPEDKLAYSVGGGFTLVGLTEEEEEIMDKAS